MIKRRKRYHLHLSLFITLSFMQTGALFATNSDINEEIFNVHMHPQDQEGKYEEEIKRLKRENKLLRLLSEQKELEFRERERQEQIKLLKSSVQKEYNLACVSKALRDEKEDEQWRENIIALGDFVHTIFGSEENDEAHRKWKQDIQEKKNACILQ